MPHASTRACSSSAASRSPASSICHTPSANARRNWPVARIASLVFPTPPAPVNVTRRDAITSRPTSRTSC
jgi:hypothetical protein